MAGFSTRNFDLLVPEKMIGILDPTEQTPHDLAPLGHHFGNYGIMATG